MATIRNALAILVLAAAALTAACDSGAKQATWLHGTWTLAYNPGHDSDDVLTFNPDGTVAIRTADDHHISGKYRVQDQTLILLVEVKDDTIGVQFEIAPDHARLTYESGAYYTKKGAS